MANVRRIDKRLSERRRAWENLPSSGYNGSNTKMVSGDKLSAHHKPGSRNAKKYG